MYFPPWSRCRNGKEKSSVWFVRTYLNIVCSYTKHVTLLHWAMKLEKFVFPIWIDTSILLKSHSGISVRFTRSCSQNPSLMLLELVIMAATSIQIQSNTNHKFIHKNFICFICIFNAIIMNLSHSLQHLFKSRKDKKTISVIFHLQFKIKIICVFSTPLDNFSLTWRSHSYRWKSANVDLCSALMVIEQRGFFSESNLLWHDKSVYKCGIRGSMTSLLMPSVW